MNDIAGDFLVFLLCAVRRGAPQTSRIQILKHTRSFFKCHIDRSRWTHIGLAKPEPNVDVQVGEIMPSDWNWKEFYEVHLRRLTTMNLTLVRCHFCKVAAKSVHLSYDASDVKDSSRTLDRALTMPVILSGPNPILIPKANLSPKPNPNPNHASNTI